MKFNKKFIIPVIVTIIILVLILTILVTKKNDTKSKDITTDLSNITNNSDIDEITIDKTDIIPSKETEKNFKNSKNISLEEIYNTVCDLIKEHLSDIQQDIQQDIEESKSAFTDIPEEDKKFLQLFSLIVSLSFDVYVKKQMIETIVDSLSSEQQSSAAPEKGKEKSKEKARQKPGDKEKNKNAK